MRTLSPAPIPLSVLSTGSHYTRPLQGLDHVLRAHSASRSACGPVASWRRATAGAPRPAAACAFSLSQPWESLQMDIQLGLGSPHTSLSIPRALRPLHLFRGWA